MLLSPVAGVRRKALTIAPLLDFPSIESILLTILKKDPHPDIQSQAGFLIASNPTENGIKTLFQQTHPDKIQPCAEMVELWEMARPTAAKFFSCDPEKIDSFLEIALAKELSFQGGAEPSYAFKNAIPQQERLPGKDWVKLFFDKYLIDALGVFALMFFAFNFIESRSFPGMNYRKNPVSQNAEIEPHPRVPEVSSGLNPAKPTKEAWVVLRGTWTNDSFHSIAELKSKLRKIFGTKSENLSDEIKQDLKDGLDRFKQFRSEFENSMSRLNQSLKNLSSELLQSNFKTSLTFQNKEETMRKIKDSLNGMKTSNDLDFNIIRNYAGFFEIPGEVKKLFEEKKSSIWRQENLDEMEKQIKALLAK
ncbi:hypothetical protein HYY75_11600 [bacterium]|nr:hypothetical protein [bacterium]